MDPSGLLCLYTELAVQKATITQEIPNISAASITSTSALNENSKCNKRYNRSTLASLAKIANIIPPRCKSRNSYFIITYTVIGS